MKPQKLISKNIALLILIALIISLVVAFIVLFNKLVATNSSGSLWFALILLVAIGLATLLYVIYISSIEQVNLLKNEIESQKNELNKALSSKKKSTTINKDDDKIEVESTINKIIPSSEINNVEKFGETILSNIAKCFSIAQGTLHVLNSETGFFSQVAGYAFYTEGETTVYKVGETLPGQVAKNQEVLNLDKVPDNYISIMSGLGKSSPTCLLIVPVISPEKHTIGIIEISAFKPFSHQMEEFFTILGNKLGEKIVPISQNPEVA